MLRYKYFQTLKAVSSSQRVETVFFVTNGIIIEVAFRLLSRANLQVFRVSGLQVSLFTGFPDFLIS